MVWDARLLREDTAAMSALGRELRATARALWRSRGFAALAMATIGIVICGATLILSIVSGALLDPGPYRDPARVLGLQVAAPSWTYPRIYFAYDDFLALQAGAAGADKPFDAMSALGVDYVMMTGGGEPAHLNAGILPGSTFARLGVPPLLGRTLTATDDRPGAPPVIVLGEEAWRQAFGGDPGAIGRVVQIDDRPHEIVGIMPRRFTWGVLTAWMPLRPDLYSRRSAFVQIAGWLRPGVSETQAHAALSGLLRGLASAHPDRYPSSVALTFTRPAEPIVREDVRQTVLLLVAAVALLGVVGCVNVAALLLARATLRLKELGLRVSMGASRWQLVRLQLVEAAILSAGGGIAGMAMAAALLPALVAIIPAGLLPLGAEIAIDWRVLLGMTGVTALVTLACGLVPALLVTRLSLEPLLRQGGGKGTGGTSRFGPVWRLLVGLEVAVAMSLLVLTAVFGRGLLSLQAEPLHYSPDRVLALGITVSATRYPTADQSGRFVVQLLERFREMAGVESATVASPGPGRGVALTPFSLNGLLAADGQRAGVQRVGADYFGTYRIPLRRGRAIDRGDEASGRRVAMVNETFARLIGVDPIGQQVRLPGMKAANGESAPAFEIIGLFEDVPNAQVLGSATQAAARAATPEIAIPFTSVDAGRNPFLVIRTRQPEPEAMIRPLQEAVWALDRDQAFRSIRTEESLLAMRRYDGPRFRTLLLALFGSLSLALVAAGVYGILSYMSSRDARSIGIRLALGADRSSVTTLIIARGLRPALVGLVCGAGAAAACGTLVRSFVWKVSPWDPAAYAAAAATLLVVTVLACYLPARRAARLDPMITLRGE